MTTYHETKILLESVLAVGREQVRQMLKEKLKTMKRRHPEFYDGIILHGPQMPFSASQWFELHQKIPHWRLRAEKVLMDKLSPSQKEKLEKPMDF